MSSIALDREAERAVRSFSATYRRILDAVGEVVVGNEEALEQIVVALFAGGHVLVEGVPGTGKTLIARSLAHAIQLPFRRIQFTIDLMPADITGTRILLDRDDGRRELVFVPGPIFTHVLLADEINRSTPKTQSALLEAMAELQVSVAGDSRTLDPPFFVVATLNPIEMEGTYPLPEAQLDRFLFKVRLPYPNTDVLRGIVDSTTGSMEPTVPPVFAAAEAAKAILENRRVARSVIVAPHVRDHAIRIVEETLPSPARASGASPATELVDRYVTFGSSPRGAQALLLAGRVRALVEGRVNVAVEDVAWAAAPALRHRMILNFAAEADGVSADRIIEGILEQVQRDRT